MSGLPYGFESQKNILSNNPMVTDFEIQVCIHFNCDTFVRKVGFPKFYNYLKPKKKATKETNRQKK